MGAPLVVVTPWFPAGPGATPLETAIARDVLAAAHGGADVTVVHLVAGTDAAAETAAFPESPHVPVRRVRVEGGAVDGGAVEVVATALVDHAADVLGAAAVVHAHAGLPVAAALAMVLPDGARLVVSEHLPSIEPLLAEGADVDDYTPVLDRAEVVLLPSEALARAFTRRFRREDARTPSVDVLPYLAPIHPSRRVPGADEPDALPLVRWLLLGGPGDVEKGGEAVVRALAADALAGAPTTLTVPHEGEPAPELTELAARLGVGDRLRVCPAGEVLGRLARAHGPNGIDLVVDPDPLAAADPVLPAAFAAGVPAILARAAGPEEVVDEVAATGGVRLLTPGPAGSAGVVALLEAVADLRRRPSPTALPVWRTSLAAGALRLAQHYGDALATSGSFGARSAFPRVLLVDLSGSRRSVIGQLARWVTGLGGEAVAVTAAAPPPCSGIAGVVTVDLRPTERALARPPLTRVRRRLPGAARPALDAAVSAYRAVRPAPTLADAALAGPLAEPTGPRRGFDAVVAADGAGAELARRWTGDREVLPAELDALVRALMERDREMSRE